MAFNIDSWLQENPYGGKPKSTPVQQSQPNPSSPSFDIEQFLKDNPFRADKQTSGDTRNIVAPDEKISLERRQRGLTAAIGGGMEAMSEIPLAVAEWATTPSETMDYVPGELRSSARDKVRAERFGQQEFSESFSDDPYTKGMNQFGYGAATVLDPLMDTGIAVAPMALRGLKGLPKLADDVGQVAGKMGREMAKSQQRGSVVLSGLTDEGTLIAQHNLSQKNLEHAEKMGGLPVPSLAVTKAEDAMTNFGEISLLADKGLIDPRAGTGAKVYGADVYSPRYPSITYDVPYAKKKALDERLSKYEDKVGGTWSSYPDVADRGRDAVERSPLVMAEFLESVGEKIPVKRRKNLQGKSTKEIDSYETRDAMERKIRKKYPEEFDAHVEGIMSDVVKEEKLFQGYTYSGNRKYKPHTLEQVTKQMKKDIRGGENFNYGPGSLRAMFTPEFKSIKQIKDAEGKLVSGSDFESMKDDLSNELTSLYEEMEPFMRYKSDNQFTNYDTFVEQLGDISKLGIRGMLNEYFPNAPTEGVKNLITKMGDFPTEYFEANILRSVGIDEFSAAVVPTGTPQKVIDKLKAKGLKVKKYKRGDDSSRKAAISKLKDLHFTVAPLALIKQEEEQ